MFVLARQPSTVWGLCWCNFFFFWHSHHGAVADTARNKIKSRHDSIAREKLKRHTAFSAREGPIAGYVHVCVCCHCMSMYMSLVPMIAICVLVCSLKHLKLMIAISVLFVLYRSG